MCQLRDDSSTGRRHGASSGDRRHATRTIRRDAELGADRARLRRAGDLAEDRPRPLGHRRLLDRRRVAGRDRRRSAGISHFIEHLLFKGTPGYTALEIAEVFDGIGGELNAATSREHTLVYSRVPDVHLETALDVMGDMVFSPLFDELETEREVVLEEIAMYEDTPQELVHDLISEAVFGNHPLGRPVIGTAEVISSVSRRAIQGYHRSMYTPANIVVSAAGNLDHDRLVELVQAVRRPPRRARRTRSRACGRRSSRTPKPGLRFQRKDTEQYHVCLGAPGISRSDRRRFAASILDAILGGSASSRLFQEIREKRGMAYAVYSFVSQYADTGPDRDLPRDARGQPRRGARDRRRADRRHRRRRPARERARAGEGEPEGPRAALDGVDLDAHEPARQGADHRLGDPLAGADRGRGRRGRARGGRGARRAAARAGAALGRRDRAERGAVPRSARRRLAVARSRGVNVLLNGYSPPSPAMGKVGAALGPLLEQAGHTLVATEAEAEAMVDFTTPDAVVPNIRRALAAGVPCVVGTTGWDTAEVDAEAREAGVAVFFAPNFAIGAVLMMRFAAEASAYMEAAEIDRAAPRDQARRAVGHGEGDRGGDAGRRADPLGAAAGARRAPGGDPRRDGGDADDPPRHDLARGVRAGRPARAGEARHASARRHGRARRAALKLVEEQIRVGEVELSLLRPPDPEALIDEERVRRGRVHAVLGRAVALGTRARAGAAARARGLDGDRARLRARRAVARRRSARRARDRDRLGRGRDRAAGRERGAQSARRRRLCAPTGGGSTARFDLALAADVLYEQRNVEPLLDLLPRLAGEIWLADPGRPYAGAFLDQARELWHVEEPAERVYRLTSAGAAT